MRSRLGSAGASPSHDFADNGLSFGVESLISLFKRSTLNPQRATLKQGEGDVRKEPKSDLPTLWVSVSR